MTLLILGLALIISILVIVLYSLYRSDTSEIDIDVIPPCKLRIIIKKDKRCKKIKD